LNVWEQFEVQNPDIFVVQWALTTYIFFIKGPFSIIFVGIVVHNNLVSMAKVSYQSKNLWVTEKHQFSRERFSHHYVFCNYFLTFQIHFANTMSQLNDIFFHQCIFMLILKHFIVWSFFIWVGLEIKIDLQMCF